MKSTNKTSDGITVLNAYDTIEEAIAILQCAEDASNEPHVSMTIGIAVSMLLGAVGDLSKGEANEA